MTSFGAVYCYASQSRLWVKSDLKLYSMFSKMEQMEVAWKIDGKKHLFQRLDVLLKGNNKGSSQEFLMIFFF